MFVAQTYCDITNISWRKGYFSKTEFGGVKQLQPKLGCGNKLLEKKHAFNYIIQTMVL
jgi:hypothetical protein